MYKEDGKISEVNTTKQPVATRLLKDMAQVAEFASSLSEKVDIKLAPITYERVEGGLPDDEKQEEYPALFSEMRNMLSSISASLFDIDNSINRVEL